MIFIIRQNKANYGRRAVTPSAGVEMDVGRLAGDMKWKKEAKLMPGVKFGIKYRSATRHRNEVSTGKIHR